MENDIFTEEELEARFNVFWEEANLQNREDNGASAYTLVFLAYKKGLADGWDDAIEAHR